MKQRQKQAVTVNVDILNTDLWYTGFGMTLKQLWNPSDKILLEGQLYKYKPGIDTMYITRWCQLTKNAIRVYKNQMTAKGFITKPQIALPLSVFRWVKKSKFIVPEKGKNAKLVKMLNKNQFELWYSREVLDVIMLNFLKSKIIEEENIDQEEHMDLGEILFSSQKGKDKDEWVRMLKKYIP